MLPPQIFISPILHCGKFHHDEDDAFKNIFTVFAIFTYPSAFKQLSPKASYLKSLKYFGSYLTMLMENDSSSSGVCFKVLNNLLDCNPAGDKHRNNVFVLFYSEHEKLE